MSWQPLFQWLFSEYNFNDKWSLVVGTKCISQLQKQKCRHKEQTHMDTYNYHAKSNALYVPCFNAKNLFGSSVCVLCLTFILFSKLFSWFLLHL